MAHSDYLETAFLNHLLGGTSFTAPATLYIGLSTTATTDAGSYTEPSGGAYARVAVTSADFGAASSRQIANSTVINFPTATAGWGTVTHWFIADAASAGNVLFHGALSTSRTINNGDQYYISVGNLAISFTAGGVSNYAANAWLDHVFGNASLAQPANYLALSTANPTDDGTGLTEPADTYARQQVSAGGWTISGNQAQNANDIIFPEAGASWGTLTHCAVMDALTVGNMLVYGALAASVSPAAGETVRAQASQITITID